MAFNKVEKKILTSTSGIKAWHAFMIFLIQRIKFIKATACG